MEQEAINQKYQLKKYPCGVDKFRGEKDARRKLSAMLEIKR